MEDHEYKLVYLIRHGESEANAASTNGSQILDPPLTALGWMQAEALTSLTSKWKIECVLVSPLLRTLQTASLAFRGSSVPFYVTRSAREHGWHEPQNRGSPLDILCQRLIASGCGEEVTKFKHLRRLGKPHEYWDPILEGKLPRKTLHQRRTAASKQIFRKIVDSPNQTFAIVCHYCVIKKLTGLGTHNADVVRCVFRKSKHGHWRVHDAQLLIKSDIDDEDVNTDSDAIGADRQDYNEEKCELAACIENFPNTSGSDFEELTEDSSSGVRRSASVLVVGTSAQQGGRKVALLGGGPGQHGYQYCDFDCGSVGQSESRGPFDKLSRVMLGLHGRAARHASESMWRVCRDALAGGTPVQHGRCMTYIVFAESILNALGLGDQISESISGIEYLAAQFQRNSKVKDVKLVSIAELLRGIEEERTVAPLTPVWGFFEHLGRPHVFGISASASLEAHRLCSANEFRRSEGEVSMKNRGCQYLLNPVTMISRNADTDRERHLFRWDSIPLSSKMSGPNGSIACCSSILAQLLT
mmetsp:Transcript_98872/g.154484  ORF Transcript_98872/g.154484 Transcript_98872/m.154484 type:complete len:528 (-) Transcript_98872:152-1735(-)